MKLEGTVELPGSREQVWDLMMNPEVIAAILPGCRDMTSVGEDRYEAVIEAKIGAIVSRYSTKFQIAEKSPPEFYKLLIEGEGKGGFMRGEAQITLSPAGSGGTTLAYIGEGMVGGKIARIGQRLVETAGKMLIQRGFKALKAEVEKRLAGDPSSASSS